MPGTSPAMIKKHYLEVELPNGRLINPEVAAEWFGISKAEAASWPLKLVA